MDKYLWEHVQIFLERDDLFCQAGLSPAKLGPGRVLIVSSDAGLLTPSVGDVCATGRRPEVPVVETTPSSIAALPAVAISPQLFEPTESECAASATIGDVMRWAGFPSGPSNAAVCKRQSILSVFGAEETDHVRVLANLPADQLEELLREDR